MGYSGSQTKYESANQTAKKKGMLFGEVLAEELEIVLLHFEVFRSCLEEAKMSECEIKWDGEFAEQAII